MSQPPFVIAVCDVPGRNAYTALEMAIIVGHVLEPAFASQDVESAEPRCKFIMVDVGYDNHIAHRLVDGALLGLPAPVHILRDHKVPFFSNLSYPTVDLKFFPYLVPLTLRSDMRKKLTVYESRDPPHVFKIMVSQMRTLARIVVLGEFFVDMTHGLSKGLPPHCYYGKDRQSDSEAMSCINACIFQDELSWNSVGSFVL